MGQHQRASRGKRKGKQSNRHWCLVTFLLVYLPAAPSLTVEGQKDGNITLPCSCIAEDASVRLTSGSLIAYGAQPHAQYEGRVHRSFQCDLILQGLKTIDAGNYILSVSESDGDLIPKCIYDVIINVHLTGWKGKELVFELPRGAERVICSSETGVQSKVVWERGKGFLHNQPSDSDGCFTISNFRASDAGAYSIQNAAGRILNTIMVTECKPMEGDRGEQNSGLSVSGVCRSPALLFLTGAAHFSLTVL